MFLPSYVALTWDRAQKYTARPTVPCTCVISESYPVYFTCNFETTAGTLTSATVSFTYCITLGWFICFMHPLQLPCLAVHVYLLITSLLSGKSHTSQAVGYHADTAVSYSSVQTSTLSLQFSLSYTWTRDMCWKEALASSPLHYICCFFYFIY